MGEQYIIPVEGLLESAQEYLERTDMSSVQRGNKGRLAPRQLLIQNLPLTYPLPPMEFQTYLNGAPDPDRGVTAEWPAPESV